MVYVLVCNTEPAEPPENVTTMVESSTEIQVSWEEVPAIDQNGEIITYEVQYEPVQTFNGQISTAIMNTSMLSINLTGLQEFVDYNISVRAYTSAGPGPYSEEILNTTAMDGKPEVIIIEQHTVQYCLSEGAY